MAAARRPGMRCWGTLLLLCCFLGGVEALGSMSAAAAVYGGNGPALCELNQAGGPVAEVSSSTTVTCFGSNAACVYGAPQRLPLSGLTAGDGFVCGLTLSSFLPYCWGNNMYVHQGFPSPISPNVTYSHISAGDNHLCALRRLSGGGVDCWGYNLTVSYFLDLPLFSITSGSLFSCALLAKNGTPVCWGDDTGSGVISTAPRHASFRSIAAGGYHVCGVLANEGGATLCWGRSLQGFPADAHFSSMVGGKFHACGLLASAQTPSCWGFVQLPNSTTPPESTSFSSLVAGDYYTCGFPSNTSRPPLCWGSQFPAPPSAQLLPPPALCNSPSCGRQRKRDSSTQVPILIAELAIAIVVVACTLTAAIFIIKYKLSSRSSAKRPGQKTKIKHSSCSSISKKGSFGSSFRRERVRPADDPKMFRAEIFSFRELEVATAGFSQEYEVGRGSCSYVYRGVLSDGRMVAVKRLMVSVASSNKDPAEFRNEVDLLSRLNHAHLLTLLGFCDEREERILVYEYMANGTLHEQLHGDSGRVLGWVRRVTIAVQAARGLEYLHGYACPPVIHRDVKSSNILLDDDWNARVSNLGYLGHGCSADPPLATGGYVDPEYHTHHYFTTKSDVYSFGVLLLELLSGRKAEAEMVEWALPIIKAGQVVQALLDPRLDAPEDVDAIARVARIAAKSVRLRGKDRPSMEKVTTSLERALATMIGSFSGSHPLLPSEVVLGSSRLHRKSSQRSSWCNPTAESSSVVSVTTAIAIVSEDQQQRQQRMKPSSADSLPSLDPSAQRRCSSDHDMAVVSVGAGHHQKKTT